MFSCALLQPGYVRFVWRALRAQAECIHKLHCEGLWFQAAKGNGICQSDAEEQILAYKARQSKLLCSLNTKSQESCLPLPSLLADVKGTLIDTAHRKPQLLVLALTLLLVLVLRLVLKLTCSAPQCAVLQNQTDLSHVCTYKASQYTCFTVSSCCMLLPLSGSPEWLLKLVGFIHF